MAKDLKKLNVFVVDDDVLYLKSIIFNISKEFADTVNFKYFFNAQGLLDKLKEEEKPDIILLDYNLGIGDDFHGMSLISEIKKVSDQPEIVVISAQSNKQIIAGILRGGASSYIQKTNNLLVDIKHLLNMALIKKTHRTKRPFFMMFLLSIVASIASFIFFR